MHDTLVDQVRSEKLKRLYRFWTFSQRPDGAPTARDIDVEGLAPWARDLAVMEVGEKRRYRYGYYGPTLAQAFGRDMTGAHIDELPTDQANILTVEYEHVRRTREPHWRVYEASFGGTVETWERLALPLLKATGRVGHIFVTAYRCGDKPKRAKFSF